MRMRWCRSDRHSCLRCPLDKRSHFVENVPARGLANKRDSHLNQNFPMGRVAKTDMAILDSNISVSTILPEKLPIIRDQTDLSIRSEERRVGKECRIRM